MSRDPREPDALDLFVARQCFDFLDPPGWDELAPFFFYALGAAVLGLFFAYLSREQGMTLLKRPSRWLWLGGSLGAVAPCALMIPRIGKFVILVTLLGVGVPIAFFVGTSYVFEGDSAGTAKGGSPAVHAGTTEREQDPRASNGVEMVTGGVAGKAKAD